jgi:peptidoglycan/LPS O-acetylase OafA/YrhL
MKVGLFGTVSIGDRLRSSGGVGHGFDLLRLILATSVVAWHSNWIVGNDIGDNTPYVWFPGYAILSLFFALSGFLIAGSAARLKLREFLLNRGLRIFPALAVEIVLSAFILGPIFTSLPAKVYLGSGGTWHYLTIYSQLLIIICREYSIRIRMMRLIFRCGQFPSSFFATP